MSIVSYLPVIVPLSVILLLLIILAMAYVKAAPDEAIIISGLRRDPKTKPKVLIGKAGLKIPFLERKDILHLALIPIDVKTSNAVPTADYININVDAAVNIKIGDSPEMLSLAAQNFLNMKTQKIAEIAREVLEGNLREIVGQMPLEQMVSDRQVFAEMVKGNAEPDLKAMGLEIISFNVQNFSDEHDVITNLGVDNVEQISKKAAIAKAEARKEVDIATAKASKEANDAKVQAETEIAERNNELAIKKAELKKIADTKKAESDAAYQIQQEEQRKTIEITTANANLARQEKEIELKDREVAIKERALEATVKKEAEARKYAAQQDADAKLYETQKQSEAELFERAKRAEAEQIEAERRAEATKAESNARRIAAENEAEGIKAKGEAEATAIQAKAVAEAEGILKKAEAMKQYGEAAQMDMQLKAITVLFEQMPAIAEAVGKAYSNVDKIYMYGGESSKLQEDIMKNITQVSEGLTQSMGIDLKGLLSGVLGAKLVGGSDVSITMQNPNDEITS